MILEFSLLEPFLAICIKGLDVQKDKAFSIQKSQLKFWVDQPGMSHFTSRHSICPEMIPDQTYVGRTKMVKMVKIGHYKSSNYDIFKHSKFVIYIMGSLLGWLAGGRGVLTCNLFLFQGCIQGILKISKNVKFGKLFQ